MFPPYSILKKQFYYVSSSFENAEWKNIGSDDPAPVKQMEVVNFEKSVSSEEAISEMMQKGLRPATHEELYLYSQKDKKAGKKYPILALGSETHVNGYRNVAYLWNDDNGRNLNLNWIDNDWNDNYRFLAVRKSLHVFSNNSHPLDGGCFVCRYFCQPPMSFPISFNGTDKAAYLL
jgi:hypothetical protein